MEGSGPSDVVAAGQRGPSRKREGDGRGPAEKRRAPEIQNEAEAQAYSELSPTQVWGCDGVVCSNDGAEESDGAAEEEGDVKEDDREVDEAASTEDGAKEGDGETGQGGSKGAADFGPRTCPICFEPCAEENERQWEWMECCHRIHANCLRNAMSAQGVQSVPDFACPACLLDVPRPCLRPPGKNDREVVFQVPATQGGIRAIRRPRMPLRPQSAPSAPQQPPRARPSEELQPLPRTDSSLDLQPGDPAHGGGEPFSQPSQSLALVAHSPQRTQGGGQPATLVDEDMGFKFVDSSRLAQSAHLNDPTTPILEELVGAADAPALSRAMHPRGLFHGLEDEARARTTILAWLRGINADVRSHREIGADSTFSLRYMAPRPLCAAIQTVALKEGWTAESLHQALLTNTGWLEHHETRLKVRECEEHARSPNIPHFSAGDPSQRKSSLKTYTSRTLMNNDNAPPEIRDGTATSGDGTIRGHRASIMETHRSGTLTDEVTTVYDCGPYSEQAKGVHWLSRQKMQTYVNSERDCTVTGQGSFHLENYAFIHQVLGQHEPIEFILRPTPTGFTKRFHQTWNTTVVPVPDQRCDSSKRLLADYHQWMCRHALPFSRIHFFDNFALSLFRAATQAVDDFLSGDQEVDVYFAQKLRFADTDVLRFTNVMMRACMMLTDTSGQAAGQVLAPHLRRAWSIYELCYALHIWKRQLALHHGFYISDAARAQAPSLRAPARPAGAAPGTVGGPSAGVGHLCLLPATHSE